MFRASLDAKEFTCFDGGAQREGFTNSHIWILVIRMPVSVAVCCARASHWGNEGRFGHRKMPKNSPVATVARNVEVSRTVTFGFWSLECLSASRCAVPGPRIEEMKGVSGIAGCQRVRPLRRWRATLRFHEQSHFGFWALECLTASQYAVPGRPIGRMKGVSGITRCQRIHLLRRWRATCRFHEQSHLDFEH